MLQKLQFYFTKYIIIATFFREVFASPRMAVVGATSMARMSKYYGLIDRTVPVSILKLAYHAKFLNKGI